MVEHRQPKPTVDFIDEYCSNYKNLFCDVRSFEAFKYLHMGMLSEIKRKTLPEIAKVVGLENHQQLHHFLTNSPWEASKLRLDRLELILKVLSGRPIILIIDETGDKKKGKSTDYVKRQYIGNLGKIENGIVAVTAYGVFCGMTFPLTFEIYKPRERLREGDKYQTKPEIAGEMICSLQKMGFRFNLVLADSLYGESEKNFTKVLDKLDLKYLVAIRSNHQAWMPPSKRVQHLKWQRFKRVFSDLTRENRYIREIICGKRTEVRYWQITTDTKELPSNTTWFVMSKYPEITPREVGNFYGLRTWVEYGLKQSKNELGWADFRVTSYPQIEKWWEIVCSAYLLVSLHGEQLLNLPPQSESKFSSHPQWNEQNGWKNILNNLRLMIQPFLFFNLIKPWFKVFQIPQLHQGFLKLMRLVNYFTDAIFNATHHGYLRFSSA